MRAHYKTPFLLGVDEAGRGPLAGPVVCATVLLEGTHHPSLAGVRDSKTLSESKREGLFEDIRKCARSVAVAWAHPCEIDRSNILRASLDAMSRAAGRILRRFQEPVLVVVDGIHEIPGVSARQTALVDADRYSLAVACASVVAKVVRDRWMRSLDRKFPGYGFAAHKGYGTPEHRQALERLGPSLVHRLSFAPVRQPVLPL